VRRPFAGDLAALAGRGPNAVSRWRKVVFALAVLLVVAGIVFLALHGIIDDGPGKHGFDGG
jgi:hypothetical protein